MTEKSYFWGGTTVGDATLAPYSDDFFSDFLRDVFQKDRTIEGVIFGSLNEMACTGTASPVTVDTGRMFIDGKVYANDATLNVAIPTPAGATRIDLIVVRKSFAAQTVRIAVVSGNEGGGAPSPVQVDGTTWDVPIAQASITTGGVITLTDLRHYANFTLPNFKSGAQAYGDNYIISATVASNNLTVSLKTLSGRDPSSTGDPLTFRIKNTRVQVTSALSLTINAGTNTFNAGASILATLKVQYFVYAGLRESNSTPFIIVSRFPGASTYADFSATAINEKYGAYSGTAPASTDPVEVIGRFDAILSAGASYNWSLPASPVVISRPIYETDWLTYIPTITGFSSAPSNTNYFYKITWLDVVLSLSQGTNGTSNLNTFTQTLPITPKTITNHSWRINMQVVDNSVIQATPGLAVISSASATMDLYKDSSQTAGSWSATNGKRYVSINNFSYQY
jgi:hypothetical protein